MVGVGSRALPLRRAGVVNILENNCYMGEEEDRSYNKKKKKQGMGRKPQKQGFGFDRVAPNKKHSGHGPSSSKAHKSSKPQDKLIVRKQVDPESAKYFSEIANLFDSNEVELEERSVICANALEETRGKEFELATDYIISHTLQLLLGGCDVDHLCGFLRSCAEVFPFIAMDRSGSHVAETALKSLAMHLQDEEAYAAIEDTLTMICKGAVAKPIELMCNRYGSHVLRRLLCLCKGVSLDSPELHGMKSSASLAERLNLKASRTDEDGPSKLGRGFPDLLKFLISGLLNCSKDDIWTLVVDQFSSLVLQTALKLLAGEDQELLQIIPTILGCNRESVVEGNLIHMAIAKDAVALVKENSFSHLLEVILDVAPDSLFDEILNKIFRNSLFEVSSDQCGSFVVQSLIAKARSEDQMHMIWEEIGTKFKDLLAMGRSGVIAALIAASQRLHAHEKECCQVLLDSVSSGDDSLSCVVPRILFLDSYFLCEDQSGWKWPTGVKMNVMGSLILQAVFRYRSEFIQPFITSLTSMDEDQVIATAKDAGGARVIEAFLDSKASSKQKRRLVVKLRGHFGDLSMHPSGSFTVEKCFTASNISLREAIVSELLSVRNELSKAKHGPHLLRKLDVNGFAARPDQWRSKQASKESAYEEFRAIFGSSETRSSKDDSFAKNISKKMSQMADVKQMRKEIDNSLASASPSLGMSGSKRPRENNANGITKEKKERKKKKSSS